MFTPTSPENANAIRKLRDALVVLRMDETITYDALRRAAGRDVQTHGRHLLQRAQEAAEKELGCIFATVRDVGIKRLASQDAPSVGLDAIRRVRRTAKKGVKRLTRLNVNSFTDTERRSVIGYRAMLGAIHLLADGRKAQAIAVVADPAKPIPPANILEMFRAE